MKACYNDGALYLPRCTGSRNPRKGRERPDRNSVVGQGLLPACPQYSCDTYQWKSTAGGHASQSYGCQLSSNHCASLEVSDHFIHSISLLAVHLTAHLNNQWDLGFELTLHKKDEEMEMWSFLLPNTNIYITRRTIYIGIYICIHMQALFLTSCQAKHKFSAQKSHF